LAHLFSAGYEKKLLFKHKKIEDTTYDDIEFSYYHLFVVTVIIIGSLIFNTVFAKGLY
jgi:hypothetical protein